MPSGHLKNVFWSLAFGGIGASLSRNAGKRGPAARVPAEPLGEDGILNQNPIFETAAIRGTKKNA